MAVGAVTAILKPRATVKDGSLNQPWVHPHVSQSQDPVKGRQLHVTAPIATGEILMADTPYAVIPVVDDPISSTEILCSNSTCHRKVSNRVTCPNHCVPEVLWCSDICREADRARHGFECAWLKTKGAVLRSNEGEYYFGVLWLIVRVLAARSVESKSVRIGREKERFSSGWTAMKELCDNRGLWPEAELVQWRMLVEKYLCDQSLQTSFSAEEMLTLICQQESNSFGLYPRATGLSDGIDRGEQYAAAIYPRSSIANHSCCPNIRNFHRYGKSHAVNPHILHRSHLETHYTGAALRFSRRRKWEYRTTADGIMMKQRISVSFDSDDRQIQEEEAFGSDYFICPHLEWEEVFSKDRLSEKQETGVKCTVCRAELIYRLDQQTEGQDFHVTTYHLLGYCRDPFESQWCPVTERHAEPSRPLYLKSVGPLRASFDASPALPTPCYAECMDSC
ncbi:hypothetical protein MW887_004797 [Aspergillus wentii]|nr:hypothetical protein MW887_004797 [Aspergillus wentii]